MNKPELEEKENQNKKIINELLQKIVEAQKDNILLTLQAGVIYDKK